MAKTKTTKTAAKNGKPAKKAAEQTPAKKTETEQTGTRDAFGRPLTSAAHFVCVVLAKHADGIAPRALALEAGRLALASDVPARAAIGSQLSDMRNQKLVTADGKNGWTLTAHGRKLWGRDGKTHRTREQVDALAKSAK